jgi:hypothetical protein
MSDLENFTVRSKEFTKSEIELISNLYDKIVKRHDVCDGTGAVINESGSAEDCFCVVVHRYIRELIFANIPRKFWEVPVTVPMINFLEVDLSLLNDGGSIHGLPGSGKTMFLSYLAKTFLQDKARVSFFKMSDLENFIKHESDVDSIIYFDRLLSSDVLLLDDIEDFEFGKDFWISKKIERVLSKMVDSGKSIYFSTSQPNINEIKKFNISLGQLCEKIAGDNNAIINSKNNIVLNRKDYLAKTFVKEAFQCL